MTIFDQSNEQVYDCSKPGYRRTRLIFTSLGALLVTSACNTTDFNLDSLVSEEDNELNPFSSSLNNLELETALHSSIEPVSNSEQNEGSTGSSTEEMVPASAQASESTDSAGSSEAVEPSITILASCNSSDEVIRRRMLQLINEARAETRACGSENYPPTHALIWNTLLAETAQVHSLDMASHNFFNHTGSDGSSISDRVTRTGYDWRTVGENIAAGRNRASQTVNDWLESSGHCRNIMSDAYTQFAVSCVVDSDSDYGTYWTQVLASPK